jgi:hypothetical protein
MQAKPLYCNCICCPHLHSTITTPVAVKQHARSCNRTTAVPASLRAHGWSVLAAPVRSAPALVWDDTLTNYAYTWSKGCKWEHSVTNYGEVGSPVCS